eukprot:jgi/Chlat1/7643/Chrsp64S07115
MAEQPQPQPQRVALIVGVTGIVGNNLARRLTEQGTWKVYGLSRRRTDFLPSGVTHISADLRNAGDCANKLGGDVARSITHIFYATWQRTDTEKEAIEINGAMFRHALAPFVDVAKSERESDNKPTLKHVALVTGTKHYLGPFELYGKIAVESPFREDVPRLPHPNFYYTLEDELFQYAREGGFTWTVARPFSIIGFAPGNAMNLGQSIAVLATIKKYKNEPLVFPGSVAEYDEITDVSDANLVAEHLEWAATTPRAANEAFNVVNGDVFRWHSLWKFIADWFGLEVGTYPGHPTPLVETMKDAGPIWDEIVEKHGLRKHAIDELAVWWHADADLSRPIVCFNDSIKGREFGFHSCIRTERSFANLFQRLRDEHYIP